MLRIGNYKRSSSKTLSRDLHCFFTAHPRRPPLTRYGVQLACGSCLRLKVGTAPKIIVWETATMQTVKVLKGFHQRAVSLLVRRCTELAFRQEYVHSCSFSLFQRMRGSFSLRVHYDFFPALTQQAFSGNGSLLASVGQDDNHCLAVYDWEKGSLQHTGPSDTRAVRIVRPLVLGWNPYGKFRCRATKTPSISHTLDIRDSERYAAVVSRYNPE